MKTLHRLLRLISVFIVCHAAHASGLLTLSQNAKNDFQLYPMSMKTSAIMHDQIASTTVREVFSVEGLDSGSASFAFPLPVQASVVGLKVWVNNIEYVMGISGTPADTSHSGSGGAGVQRSSAQDIFNNLGYTQKAFIAPLGLSVKYHDTVQVELVYMEVLPFTTGVSTYSFPLKTLRNTTLVFAPTSQYSVTVLLESNTKLDTAWSPSHSSISPHREGSYAGVQYTLSHDRSLVTYTTNDFIFNFRVNQDSIKSAFFSNKPANEDGHFVFMLRPSMNTELSSIIRKNFVFILDVSGSMQGVKISQAKEAAAYCVTNLNPQDRFNVIAFSSSVSCFTPALSDATADNKSKALSYISSLYASGGTNLQDAASAGLSQYLDPNGVNVIVFLTDGIASLDQQLVVSANKNHVRICVFGIGNDVNSQQLSQLASLNNGMATFVTETGKTSAEIASFYNRIRNPFWRNLSLSVTPVEVNNVLPAVFPDVNIGEQVTIAGRYKQGGDATINLRVTTGDTTVTLHYPVHFSTDSTTDMFCPRVWAGMRISYLLNLMQGETTNSSRWLEWKQEIIRLGLRYGIVTQFTSYQNTGTVSDVEFDDATQQELAYPNPFADQTTISFDVQDMSEVEISVATTDGEVVRVLSHESMVGGHYSLMWNGRDANGRQVPSGMYICTLRIGSQTHILKLTVLR